MNTTQFNCGDAIYASQPKSLRAKYDRIVEIVRANPGISGGEISKLYHPATTLDERRQIHRRMQGMLLNVCEQRRIKLVNLGYYIVEAE